MKPAFLIIVAAACVFSAMAFGLAFGNLVYSPLLRTQNDTIVKMSEELIRTRQIRDAWKKLAVACNSELNEDAK